MSDIWWRNLVVQGEGPDEPNPQEMHFCWKKCFFLDIWITSFFLRYFNTSICRNLYLLFSSKYIETWWCICHYIFEKLILIASKSLAFDVYTKAEQKYWKSIIRNPPNHVNFIPLHGCVYTSVFLSWNYTIVAWKFMSCSFPKLFDKRWKQATTKLLFKKTNFASKKN